MSTASWASVELSRADLGDQRLNRRLARIVTDIAAAPGASLPQACGSWAATKACYSFLSSAAVSAEKIRLPHYQSTRERIAAHGATHELSADRHARVILAVQDTSSLDFTSRKSTRGLGYLQQQFQRGIMMHTAIAVTASGELLGLLSQQSWVRPVQEYGKKHQRKDRATAEKETQRWLDVQQQAITTVPAEFRVITIADREADFYEFFAADRPANAEVLIRLTHNRRISGPDAGSWTSLQQAIDALPEAGQMHVQIPRAPQRAPRQATLSISFTELEILAPTGRPIQQTDQQSGRRVPPSIRLRVVIAREIDPPAGEQPIEWRLLTTLAISSVAAAIECVEFYSQRWVIERFHYTLKSGCAIEELQLESVERLENALAVLSIVAWRLLWLVYHSRVQPDVSCEEFLEPQEWQLLYMKEHPGMRAPSTPPTLKQAVLWIAKLGGFLARRGDGDPGVKTLWRGLRRLHDFAETWKLAQNSSALMGNA